MLLTGWTLLIVWLVVTILILFVWLQNPRVAKMGQRLREKRERCQDSQIIYHSETSAEYIGNSPDEIGVGNYCVSRLVCGSKI